MVTALKKIDPEFLLAEIPKAIEDSLEGVRRVSTLVSAMKEFSHPGTKEKVALDLNRAIRSTIAVAQNEWKYVAEMETDLDATLPLVSCLPGEFNQVILNLIVNAARRNWRPQSRKQRSERQDPGPDVQMFHGSGDTDCRYGWGHSGGGTGQDIRSLLHHQGN